MTVNLRVLTFNIHKGFDATGRQFTLPRLRDLLIELDVDVILLQEVVGENQKFAKSIAAWPSQSQLEYLAGEFWPHHSYGKNAVYTGRHHGNAILSRFPIVKKENLNISTNRLEQRGLLHCELQVPGVTKTVHLFNVHLNLLHQGRLIQFAKILERSSSHVPSGSPFLLAGDFNDWSGALDPHLRDHLSLVEAHSHIHKAPAKSFPSFFPTLPLDRIYFRELQLLDCTRLTADPWPAISDHLPLLAHFAIKI